MSGKKRCKLNGGAEGAGAPAGERNVIWKHGGLARDSISLRNRAGQLIRLLSLGETD